MLRLIRGVQLFTPEPEIASEGCYLISRSVAEIVGYVNLQKKIIPKWESDDLQENNVAIRLFGALIYVLEKYVAWKRSINDPNPMLVDKQDEVEKIKQLIVASPAMASWQPTQTDVTAVATRLRPICIVKSGGHYMPAARTAPGRVWIADPLHKTSFVNEMEFAPSAVTDFKGVVIV